MDIQRIDTNTPNPDSTERENIDKCTRIDNRIEDLAKIFVAVIDRTNEQDRLDDHDTNQDSVDELKSISRLPKEIQFNIFATALRIIYSRTGGR